MFQEGFYYNTELTPAAENILPFNFFQKLQRFVA